MRPNLTKRVVDLEQRQLDDAPLPKPHFVVVEIGETVPEARERAGIPDDAEFVIAIQTVDMSIPRPD